MKLIQKILLVSVVALVMLLQSCVSNGDGTTTTTTASTTMTVTGTGDGLAISEASDIIVDDDNINLDGAFSVRVVQNGAPLSGATVSLTITPEFFRKGFYVAGTDSYARTTTVTCTAETPGSDTNGNGNIDPAGSAAITSHPSLTPTISGSNTVVTNSDGEAYFSLRYSRAVANWAGFTITATTTVNGVSIVTPRTGYVPSQLAAEINDVTTGFAGQVSPFGSSASCSDVL